MAKIERNSFGYLGSEYQVRLIAQLLTDRKFGDSIIDIISPNYFEDETLRIVVGAIKNAKAEDDIIPDISSLEFRMLEDVKDDINRKYILTQLRKIKEAELNDTLKVQDLAMKFCKQQELIRSVNQIQKIISVGNFENFDECETILRKALDHGNSKDDGINVFHDIEKVLEVDFRDPIKTGINGLDEMMDGGLAKTELGVILAALGVGKTTCVTKMANSALNDGKNVIQIFFEDNPKVIQQKHLSCWSKYDLNDLIFHRDELIEMSNDMAKSFKGKLLLKKFPSDSTTVPIIRNYIRRQIAQGFRPDIIFIDYVDCIQPSRHFDDVNVGEGMIMRQIETMLTDLNVAGWVCTQGNRSAITSEIVDTHQMGGSIKKAQIGHFIMSIARTIDQKDTKKANVAILKSRFGRDGVIFTDVLFDNAKVNIDLTENTLGNTRTEHKKIVEENDQKKVNKAFEGLQNRKKLISASNGETNN